MDIRIKRIYDEASPDDGQRLLVDRLWPRGVTKEAARLEAIEVFHARRIEQADRLAPLLSRGQDGSEV